MGDASSIENVTTYNINDKNVNEVVKRLSNKQRAWLTLMKIYALNSNVSELKKLENIKIGRRVKSHTIKIEIKKTIFLSSSITG